MKKMRKIAAVILLAALAAVSLTACGSAADSSTVSAAQTSNGENTADTSNLSGSISLAGSTSMEKVANALAESFMQKYPGVTVTAEFTGSGAGLQSLLAGQCDIGDSSRSLTDDEKSGGAVENIIAIDGIAVITDNANTASGLTRKQLTDIYTGKITNWKDVGGTDEPIVVVGRESGSGTRGAFEELLGIADQCQYAGELDSTGAVLAKVASTPGAVGYVSLDVLDGSAKTLTVDGVEATEENIKAGRYLLSRPFVMATKGEISAQSALVQEFFKYIQSDEGQTVIKGAGLILPN